MKTLAVLITFLSASLSWAEGSAAAMPTKKPSVAIWVAPIPTAILLVAGTRNQGRNYWLNLNAGANFPVGKLKWGIDAIYDAEVDDVNAERFDRVEVATGPIFHPFEAAKGFFVQPKFAAAIANFRDRTYQQSAGTFSIRNAPWFEVDAGLSAGWEWSWGPFYMAVNLGFRVGYTDAPSTMLIVSGLTVPLSSQKSPLLLNLEANLLRLGVTF